MRQHYFCSWVYAAGVREGSRCAGGGCHEGARCDAEVVRRCVGRERRYAGGADEGEKSGNLILLLLLLLLAGRLGRRALSAALLVHLLEQTKRRLLGLVDLLADLVRIDGRVASLALDGKLTELSDELLDLLLLGSVDLLLELVHRCHRTR